MRGAFILLGLSSLSTMCCGMVDFSGHQVLRAVIDTSEQAEFLVAVREQYDFWTEVGVGRFVDIRCAPDQVESFMVELSQHGIEYSVMIEDMHSYLDYLETTFDFVSTESIGKSYDGSDMRI